MVPRHIFVKDALVKSIGNIEVAANKLKEKMEATPLNDGTLRKQISLTELDQMSKRINEWAERIDYLELKGKIIQS